MVYVEYNTVYFIYIWVIYHLPWGCQWCWGNGHGPIPPAPPASTSPGLVKILTFFTELALHRVDLAICMCAFVLLLKNEGVCRDSQEQQIYRVTVVRLPLSDIAQAQNSITAIYTDCEFQMSTYVKQHSQWLFYRFDTRWDRARLEQPRHGFIPARMCGN